MPAPGPTKVIRHGGIDLDAAERAARQFLHALNVTTDDETMRTAELRLCSRVSESRK